MAAAVVCECGKTTCTFLTPKPVFALECFCCDCTRRCMHFAKASGRTPKSAAEVAVAIEGKKPLLLQYFPGKVTVTSRAFKEGEALAFSRMREGALSISCAARCCGSLLFVDSPFYGGKLVMVAPEMQTLLPEGFLETSALPPRGRCWIRDWPVEDFEKYEREHPIEGGSFYVDHENGGERVVTKPFVPTMDESKEEAVKHMEAAPETARTAQELLGENPVEVLGLAEPENSAKVKYGAKTG